MSTYAACTKAHGYKETKMCKNNLYQISKEDVKEVANDLGISLSSLPPDTLWKVEVALNKSFSNWYEVIETALLSELPAP